MFLLLTNQSVGQILKIYVVETKKMMYKFLVIKIYIPLIDCSHLTNDLRNLFVRLSFRNFSNIHSLYADNAIVLFRIWSWINHFITWNNKACFCFEPYKQTTFRKVMPLDCFPHGWSASSLSTFTFPPPPTYPYSFLCLPPSPPPCSPTSSLLPHPLHRFCTDTPVRPLLSVSNR